MKNSLIALSTALLVSVAVGAASLAQTQPTASSGDHMASGDHIASGDHMASGGHMASGDHMASKKKAKKTKSAMSHSTNDAGQQ